MLLSPGDMAQRLEAAANVAELGIFVRDDDRLGGEWNSQMYRMFQFDPAQGLPTQAQWLSRIHPDDRARMAQSRAVPSSAAEGFVEHEYRVLLPDGAVRWMSQRARCESQGSRRWLFGITVDVTHRVLTERALQRANERAALTARSVGMGIWEWSPATDESVWDDAMFRLRGIPPRPQAPNHLERLTMVHPDDREMVASKLGDTAQHAAPSAYEFRIVWPDGTVRWLASRATPVVGNDGTLTRYIGVNWDITERVEADAAKRDKLITERESKAKSEFLARISHELRTPLNAVLGFAQMLQRENPDPASQQRSRVDRIVDSGEHLLALINDVLDLSSLESGHQKLDAQALRLDEVVSEALLFVEAQAHAAGIRVQLGALDGVVHADRVRLRQIVINLLSNAIKYNRPGGMAVIASTASATTVTLSVQDNGRGMTPEQTAHLFEPFNRLGQEHSGIEGTGIGLAIVKTLAECMGGRVRASSQLGQGTRFEVDLPCGVEATAAAAAAASALDPAPQGCVPVPRPARCKFCVLYIEDNPVNVMLVEELLRGRADLCFCAATTGALGVEQARKLRPDLVLIDMQLPDFDGLEVLARLKAMPEMAAVPCVALSANAMPADIARARQAGFADYWTKPINFKAFLDALDRLLPAASGDTER